MTTPINQPAHFFDRLPAKDAAAAGIKKAYVQRRESDGHYFLSDTAFVDGATRVYFQDRDEYAGRVVLDDVSSASDRTATLFGDDLVQL